MPIDRIYIAGHRGDLRWTQCCVASIRRWYPQIPISLVKDLICGDYDTRELETYWDVDVWVSARRVHGWGMSKLEPLMAAAGERIFIIDSDIVFLGPLLDLLQGFDTDFVVDGQAERSETVRLHYFDADRLRDFDPDFTFTGMVFGGGHIVATGGLLQRSDFEPLIDFAEPPRLQRPDVFARGEQGVLNYVVQKRVQLGRLTLASTQFAHWAGYLKPRLIRPRQLHAASPHRALMHYAGPKYTLFSANRNGHLLRHFEAAYYARLPQGRRRRLRERVRRFSDVLRGRQPWINYM